VSLTSAPSPLYPGELVLDSPPAVLGDALIVGSAIDDMTRARTPGAEVRAFDARTGALRWQFDPSPARDGARLSGGGNVWAPIAVDAASGLVFLPTAGPSASYWGGERPGEDLFASSVVALDGATGRPVWRFQTTHHDIWDYDVAAQPTLATVRRDGRDDGDRAHEDGLRLRPRPRDRPARLPGHGTAGPGQRRAGRERLPDAADPRRPAAAGAAAAHGGRRLGPHLRRSAAVPAQERTVTVGFVADIDEICGIMAQIPGYFCRSPVAKMSLGRGYRPSLSLCVQSSFPTGQALNVHCEMSRSGIGVT
jgi:hypothetical protein